MVNCSQAEEGCDTLFRSLEPKSRSRWKMSLSQLVRQHGMNEQTVHTLSGSFSRYLISIFCMSVSWTIPLCSWKQKQEKSLKQQRLGPLGCMFVFVLLVCRFLYLFLLVVCFFFSFGWFGLLVSPVLALVCLSCYIPISKYHQKQNQKCPGHSWRLLDFFWMSILWLAFIPMTAEE